MTNNKRTQQDPSRNRDRDWNQRMRRRGEDVYGEGDDSFREGYEERSMRSLSRPRASDTDRRTIHFQQSSQEEEDASNYGRGGYYGNTYDPDSYLKDRDRGRSKQQERSYRINENERQWENETFLPTGYRSNEDRLRHQGIHKGKGPKGYHKSDERITEDINDRLAEDSFIDASDIEVKITNGDVTLTGTVDDRDAKRRAEDIAESVSGVKNVENRLRVNQNTDWVNREGNTESRVQETKRGA